MTPPPPAEGWYMSIDPGAERLGWCIFQRTQLQENKGFRYVGSGVLSLPRLDNEQYQVYARRIVEHYRREAERLLSWFCPEAVINELVPPVGGNASNQIQRQLAAIALTAVQGEAIRRGATLDGVGATTIKKNIGGTKKATKVAVRNGVTSLLPDLADRKSDWVKIFEEPDAIATGLTWFGLKIDG